MMTHAVNNGWSTFTDTRTGAMDSSWLTLTWTTPRVMDSGWFTLTATTAGCDIQSIVVSLPNLQVCIN